MKSINHSLFITMLGVVVTLSVVFLSYRMITADIDKKNQESISTTVNEIIIKLEKINTTLHNLQSIFQSSRHIDPDQFRILANQIIASVVFIKTISWHPRILNEHKEDFIFEMEDMGFIGFDIADNAKSDERGYALPTAYMEPYYTIGASYLGWDLLANSNMTLLYDETAKTAKTSIKYGNLYSAKDLVLLMGISTYEGKSIPEASKRKALANGQIFITIDPIKLLSGKTSAEGLSILLNIDNETKIDLTSTTKPTTGWARFLTGAFNYTTDFIFGNTKIKFECTYSYSYLNLQYSLLLVIIFIGGMITVQARNLSIQKVLLKEKNKIITDYNINLEKKVEEKTLALMLNMKERENLLSNIQIGVFAIDIDLSIREQYSQYMTSIFETSNIGGNNFIKFMEQFTQFFATDDGNQARDALHFILDGHKFNFEANKRCLPNRIEVNISNKLKFVEFDWNPVINDNDQICEIIITTRDVTNLIKLQSEKKAREEEFAIVRNLVYSGKNSFFMFCQSSREMLQLCYKELEKSFGEIDGNCIFFNLHTIKGTARSLGFQDISAAVHNSENLLNRFDEDMNLTTAGLLCESLNKIEELMQKYEKINQDVLKRPAVDSDDISNREQYAALLEEVNNGNINKIKDFLEEKSKFTLSDLKSEFANLTESVAKELEKPIPTLEIEGNIPISSRYYNILKNCFVHLFRNSLCHGIEPADKRVELNKKPHGLIKILATRENEYIKIIFFDDGGGLNIDSIRSKAVEMGIDIPEQANDDAIAGLIFESKLSTAESLTQTAGRGVGMGAIASFLNEVNGEIKINFKSPNKVKGFRPFQFEVKIPSLSSSSDSPVNPNISAAQKAAA